MSAAVASNSQRHLRLLMLLSGTTTPLRSEEIFNSVVGYRAEPGKPAPSVDALEKRFERDRETLAQLGFPVATVVDPDAPGDRSRWRFCLDRESVTGAPDAVPQDPLTITAEQLLLLDAASRMWDEAGIAADARRAYLKLLAGSSGSDTSASSPAQITHVRRTGATFAALRDAIALRQDVRFDYAKPGSAHPHTRSVAPLQLVQVEGHWLCNCYDYVRDDERNFLLRRIVGEVIATGPRRTTHEAATDLAAQLRELGERQAVSITVIEGSRAQQALSRRALEVTTHAEGVELRIPSWDHELLADELAGFAGDIRAISPRSLRDSVRARLERALRSHGSASDATTGGDRGKD